MRHYGTGAGAGSAGIHTVLEGDTLWSISKRYKIVMRDIALHNDLAPPFVLASGTRLRLPPPREYSVKAGDTLYGVSRLFAINSSELARLNDLSAPYTVHRGDVLRLPSPSVSQENSVSEERLASSASVVSDSGVPVPVRKPSAQASKPRPTIMAKTPKRSSSKFMKPVEGRVLSSYGPKKNGLHNDGVNIAAPKGTPVRAAENGVVVYSGRQLRGSGNLVLIRHENRWMTAYAHMDKRLIKRGSVVKRGQSIGTVGKTGSVDTPQLHFEVRRGTNAVNPKAYM